MAIEFLNGINLEGTLELKSLTTNTDSTTALVMSGDEVQKRTLGSLAFSSATIPSIAGLSGFNFGGTDLTFQGTDPGDIVWKNADGTEVHRIWSGSNDYLTYRNDAGTTYGIIHEGFSGYNNGDWDNAFTHAESTHAPTDAEANVQANWTETTTTSDSFIVNKPSTFTPSAHNHDGDYIQDGGTTAIGDINTIGTESIKHRWNNVTTGRPAAPQSNEYGTVTTLTYDSSNATQLAWDIHAGNLYGRTLNLGDDTGTWKRFVTSTELPDSYAPTDAEANVQADWTATTGDALILNKPTIPTVPDSYAPTNAEQNVQADWDAADGDAHILNKPTIPTVPDSYAPTDAEANVQADWTEATTTSDSFILNKPTTFAPSAHNHNDIYYTETEIDANHYGKVATDARFTSSDGSEDEWKFTLGDEGNLTGNKWYKVARVNQGDGGLYIKGFLSNHVETFGTQKVDLLIQGRETNTEIEISGTVDVLHNATGSGTDKVGIRVIKSDTASNANWDYWDVYIRTTRYSQAKFHLVKAGSASFYTAKPSVTTEPAPVSGGTVELDTSTLTEGNYVVDNSTPREIFHEGHKPQFSEIESTPTTLSGYGITDAAASNHNHDSAYVNVGGDTMTGVLKLNSELQFQRGGTEYSNYIRSAQYVSEGYDNSGTPPTDRYWLEYGAKGGHHFVVNTDGGAGTTENAYDDFTIWNGAVEGDRLFEVTNAGNTSITGNLVVGGNLTVNGTVTTLNTATVEVEDNILQLNTTQGSTDTATAATSGISIYRGDGITQASLIFDDGDDVWDLTNKLKVASNIYSGGNVFQIEGANPYIKGTGTGSMRIKHTSGQTMYIRPDETGAISFFEGANSQTVSFMTATPLVNDTTNESAKLSFHTRSRTESGTSQGKYASIKHLTNTIDGNKTSLEFSGSNKARFNMPIEAASGLYYTGDTHMGFIPYPKGAQQRSDSSAHTGYIKIKIPTDVGASPDDMISFYVDIYDYTTNETISVFVGGYMYRANSTPAAYWYNCTAIINTKLASKYFTVRFGNDGTNFYVAIGEPTTVWSHPCMVVRDFQCSYRSNVEHYIDGWNISISAATLVGVDETQTGNLPQAKNATTLAGLANTHYLNYNNLTNTPTIPTDFVSAASGGEFGGDLSVKGNILLTGDVTTGNTDRTIDFTGFDKEGITDFSDRAFIKHTTNTGGHAGSVLEISSQNDVGDGIAFTTHSSSLLRHNGNAIFSTGHKPTYSEIAGSVPTWNQSTTGTSAYSSDSGLLQGQNSSYHTGVTGRHVFPGLGASGTQAKRKHIGRVYYCPKHWDTTWQNIYFTLNEETYSSGYVKYHLFGFYNGTNNQTLNLKVVDYRGPNTDIRRYKMVLGDHTDTGWLHSGQAVYYTDIYVEVAYYKSVKVVVDTLGHGITNTNPTSGAGITVIYTTPVSTDITTYVDAVYDTTYLGSDTKIWNSSNDGPGSGLDADTVDGTNGSLLKRINGEVIKDIVDDYSAREGTWTTGTNESWGPPNITGKYAYTDGGGGSITFDVPSGMESCWISQLTWSSGGYLDVLGVQSDGGEVFLRRINTHQAVQNSDEGNGSQHDGSTVAFAGTSLSSFGKIKFQNRAGRFHMTGIAFSSSQWEGTEGTGMIHPAQITQQGSGNGLDSDKLDGQQGTYYLDWDNFADTPTTMSGYGITDGLAIGTTSTTALAGDTALLAIGTTATTAMAGNTSIPSAHFQSSNTGYVGSGGMQNWNTQEAEPSLNPTTDWFTSLRIGHGHPVDYYSNTLGIQMTGGDSGRIYTRTITNGSAGSWKKYYHTGDFATTDFATSAHNHDSSYMKLSSTTEQSIEGEVLFNDAVQFDGDISMGGQFASAVKIQTTGGAMLVLKDTNSVGDAANPYIAFLDSANTRQGYVGMGSSGNAKLHLEGLDGIKANNHLEAPSLSISGNIGAYGVIDSYSGITTSGTGSFAGKVDFQGDAAIEGGSGYGVFKGYSTNDNHFISVRGVVANTATTTITGGHQTTFVEHADSASEGWYFKSKTTGTYREIARIDGTNQMYLGGNKVWNAGNDGSGSGLDADTVDGSHSNGSYGAGRQYDFTINGNADVFYPVVIMGASNPRMTRITVFRSYSETAPSTWNTASHKGGLTLDMDIRVGGWGGFPNMMNVHDFGEIYSRICGGAYYTAHTMKFVVWLRGGGASYHIDSPNPNLSIEVNDSTSASNYVTGTTGLGAWYSYDHPNSGYDVTVAARDLADADNGAKALLAYMPIRHNGSQNKVISGVSLDTSLNANNANTLDNLDSASFLRSDANDSATGKIGFSGAVTMGNSGNTLNGHIYYSPHDSAGNHYPHFLDGSGASGTTVNWRQYYGSNLKTHTWTSDSSGNMVFNYQGKYQGDSLQIDGTSDLIGHVNVGSASDTSNRDLYLHGSAANKKSRLRTTNGNLHIDSAEGHALYLNYYYGASTNIYFGSGNGGSVGSISSSGLLRMANDVVAYYSFSDKRLKTDIKSTEGNLEKILSLNPVEYTWKEGPRKGVKEIGLIAQEVEEIVPEVVRVQSRHDNETGDGIEYKQVDYEHLVSTLIGAMQEQQKQIDELKSMMCKCKK